MVIRLRSVNMSVKVLLILGASALISVVRGDSLLTPCRTDDVECLSKTTSQFLSNTCKGIPEYDIRAIDPLIIDSTDYEAPEPIGLKYHFKNLKITGLKDQQFSDFKMNTGKQEVVLTTNADISIAGEVTVEFTNKVKTYTGTFTASGNVADTATYNYSFKTDDKGITHYEVGPEKITCQLLGEPKVMIDPELGNALNADPDVKALRQNHEQISTLRKEVFCYITATSYATVIHNIRAAAKILPTTSFLIGV